MAQSFYSREEAAQVLQVSPEQLDQMRMNGQIAGHEEAGAWKFSKTQVNTIAANRTSVFDSHQGMPNEFGSEAGALPSSEYGSSEAGSSMGSEMGSSEAGSSEYGSSEMGSSEFTTDGAKPDSSSEFDLGPIGEGGPPAKSSSNDFDMLPQSPPPGDIGALAEFDVGSDIDIGSTPGTPSPTSGPTTAKQQPSILKLAPDEPGSAPSPDSLEFDLPPAPSVVGIGSTPPAAAGSSKVAGRQAPNDPQSEVRLDQLSGSFEFSMNVDSSSRRLAEAAGPTTGPKSGPKGDNALSSPKVEGQTEDDSDVRLDFDPGAAPPDDELIGIGDKPDSDVRIDPVSEVRARSGGLLPPSGGGQDLMETEEIDLGAELQQAAEASLAKRPRTTPAPSVVKTKGLAPSSGTGKTVIPEGPKPTMLPETSPFELTSDDLGDAGSVLGTSGSGLGTSGMGDSNLGVSGLGTTGGASEFELTLAPEDEAPKTHPLNLGDDEDIDLGAAPGGRKNESSSNRAELSGINLQVPADSGVLLSGKKKKSGPGSGVKAAASDDESVDFELTLDEDVSGPKTIRGKITDSDSEFELTLDEAGGSSKSLSKVGDSGEQKDIFETDFDLQGAAGQDESGSQAVALSDEPDTDLESSDFDLALDDQSASDSLSEVGALDESTSDDSVPKGKTKVLTDDSSLSSSSDDMSLADHMDDDSLLDTGGEEESPAPEEEEAAPMSVPAAQADWGIYPLIMMIPCVVVMLLASLMSYELVHSMWGFHQTTKPSGLLVEGFANMFKSDDVQPGAPGAPKAQ